MPHILLQIWLPCLLTHCYCPDCLTCHPQSYGLGIASATLCFTALGPRAVPGVHTSCAVLSLHPSSSEDTCHTNFYKYAYRSLKSSLFTPNRELFAQAIEKLQNTSDLKISNVGV